MNHVSKINYHLKAPDPEAAAGLCAMFHTSADERDVSNFGFGVIQMDLKNSI